MASITKTLNIYGLHVIDSKNVSSAKLDSGKICSIFTLDNSALL